jgi:hypothetical protein
VLQAESLAVAGGSVAVPACQAAEPGVRLGRLVQAGTEGAYQDDDGPVVSIAERLEKVREAESIARAVGLRGLRVAQGRDEGTDERSLDPPA